MKGAQNLISVIELKRLLIDIKDKRPDICIRLRFLGEMWMTNFVRIVAITEKGAVLNDELNSRLFTLPNFETVMQFELDQRFQNFQPYFHYEVRPVSTF